MPRKLPGVPDMARYKTVVADPEAVMTQGQMEWLLQDMLRRETLYQFPKVEIPMKFVSMRFAQNTTN